jgi:hypothetical protein
VGTRGGPQPDSVALPPRAITRGWPSSHFGENELSPGLMRLSLLPTGHPPIFQHRWVRPSTTRYGGFSLPMGRSPGFASLAPDRRPVRTRFRWGSPPEAVNRPDTRTRRIIMQKARGQAERTARRPPTARRHGVSGSVSSPRRGSSHRSVALLASLSVVARYLALRDGPRRFGPGSTCPTLLGYHSQRTESVTYGTVTRSGAPFQAASVGPGLDDSGGASP